MNFLLEKNIITEQVCGNNFSYIIGNNDDFSVTEYKVLQSQNSDDFIKCMRILFNGNIGLYYISNGYKQLSSLLANIDAQAFITVVANLLNAIIKVKSNGFLSCESIDISFEKIFVNPNNYKVSLIYLPVKQKAFEDYSAFENRLRTDLIKIISALPTIESKSTIQLGANLSNGTLSIEELFMRLKGVSASTKTIQNNILNVISTNSNFPLNLHVDKDIYILGKNKSAVDGVISFNNAVSRIHCRIERENDGYYIKDLNSANGTFVNNSRIKTDTPIKINNGDIIRLANSEFKAVITTDRR